MNDEELQEIMNEVREKVDLDKILGSRRAGELMKGMSNLIAESNGFSMAEIYLLNELQGHGKDDPVHELREFFAILQGLTPGDAIFLLDRIHGFKEMVDSNN